MLVMLLVFRRNEVKINIKQDCNPRTILLP